MAGSSWLLKTEPGDFSYGDLEEEGTAVWDGVRNAQALGYLRTAEEGDEVLIYHSGKERAVVGRGRVVRNAYPAPGEADPRFVVIDVAAEERLVRRVTLRELREDSLFAESPLVRQGRLSVVPLTPEQSARIHALAGAP